VPERQWREQREVGRRRHRHAAKKDAAGQCNGREQGSLVMSILRLRFVEAQGQTVNTKLVRVLMRHFESRAVLRPRPPMIVDARGGDVCVAEPFLNLGNVGLVVEGIGGGRHPQRVRADLESELRRIGPHQLVDAIRGDRADEFPVRLCAPAGTARQRRRHHARQWQDSRG